MLVDPGLAASEVGDSADLVKLNGKVQYSVVLTTGTSPIPSGSTLTLTTHSDTTPDIVTYSGAVCTAAGGLTMTPGQAIPTASLAANTTWICKFNILVTGSHVAAGMIGPFDVSFGYSGVGVTAAYYIPKAVTNSVEVYTGAAITGVSWQLVEDDHVHHGEQQSVRIAPLVGSFFWLSSHQGMKYRWALILRQEGFCAWVACLPCKASTAVQKLLLLAVPSCYVATVLKSLLVLLCCRWTCPGPS